MDNEAGSKSSEEEKHLQDGLSGATKQKSRLIAGDDQIFAWVREVWGHEHPIIPIWQTEEDPSLMDMDPSDKFIALDFVRFYNKEHFYSLFFPHGFTYGVYNLVLVGIKDDMRDIVHVPMNGMLKGWLLGADMEELVIEVDIDL